MMVTASKLHAELGLIGWLILLAQSCGRTSYDADEPMPGAPCEGSHSELSADGCSDCVCRAGHWTCTELCTVPQSEGGRGGTISSGPSKADAIGIDNPVFVEVPDWDGLCEIEKVVLTTADLKGTDGCDATYRCSEGTLLVSCDADGETNSCDCYVDGRHYDPAGGALFEGSDEDPCLDALNSCIKAWVPDTALAALATCGDMPLENVEFDDEDTLAELLLGAWLACPTTEPLSSGSAGIEFREGGTWAALVEVDSGYARGEGAELTGSWTTGLENEPVLLIPRTDGGIQSYRVTLGEAPAQIALSEGEVIPGAGKYVACPTSAIAD